MSGVRKSRKKTALRDKSGAMDVLIEGAQLCSIWKEQNWWHPIAFWSSWEKLWKPCLHIKFSGGEKEGKWLFRVSACSCSQLCCCMWRSSWGHSRGHPAQPAGSPPVPPPVSVSPQLKGGSAQALSRRLWLRDSPWGTCSPGNTINLLHQLMVWCVMYLSPPPFILICFLIWKVILERLT